MAGDAGTDYGAQSGYLPVCKDADKPAAGQGHAGCGRRLPRGSERGVHTVV